MVQEPYSLPLSEIENLTPYQLRHILLRPDSDDSDERDFLNKRREGKIDPDYIGIPQEGYANTFYKFHLGLGKPRAEVDKLWKEYLAKTPPPSSSPSSRR